jgi:hypothetical protein
MASGRSQTPEIQLLVQVLDEAYDRKSWHGTNLRGSLRGLTAKQASWRPAVGRHNIWELTVHAAYWKYSVRRRLLDEQRGSFPLKGSNWFERPEQGGATEDAWRADLALLADCHRTLRAAIERLDPDVLNVVPRGSRTTLRALLTGVAAHDLYHAGQIQLLKRLQSPSPHRS